MQNDGRQSVGKIVWRLPDGEAPSEEYIRHFTIQGLRFNIAIYCNTVNKEIYCFIGLRSLCLH